MFNISYITPLTPEPIDTPIDWEGLQLRRGMLRMAVIVVLRDNTRCMFIRTRHIDILFTTIIAEFSLMYLRS